MLKLEPTKLEKLNLTFTVVGPIVILAMLGWISWSFNARMMIERQTEDAFNAQNYVSKTWFVSTETATNQRLDRIDNNIQALQQGQSRLEGALGFSMNKVKTQ